jgi:hypothetical protein
MPGSGHTLPMPMMITAPAAAYFRPVRLMAAWAKPEEINHE